MRKAKLSFLLTLATILSLPVAAADPATSDSTAIPAEQRPSTSTVMGKGPGMGRDYQKNVPGPGSGEPEHRGADGTGPSGPGEPNDVSPKGKNGAGLGAGYPGHRGHGADDSPGHKQYGNPPRHEND